MDRVWLRPILPLTATFLNSFIDATTDACERSRLQSGFFTRLVKKEFESLAKELPTSPTNSRFATGSQLSMSPEDNCESLTSEPRHPTLSMISSGRDVTVAEDHRFTFAHIMYAFASLEELRRTAAGEVVTFQRKFQPLPLDLRPRKMSLSTPEGVQTPRRSKKSRVVTKAATREGSEDDTYEETGLRDDTFVRATPRGIKGAPEKSRAQMEADREVSEDLPPSSIINEALVLDFVREMHERFQVYSGEQEPIVGEGVAVDTTAAPSFSPEELLGSILAYRERFMRRRHDSTLALEMSHHCLDFKLQGSPHGPTKIYAS